MLTNFSGCHIILLSCQGKQEQNHFLWVSIMILVKWWAVAFIRKLQIKYHKINGLGTVSRIWTLTLDAVLHGLKLFRGLMTWIFIYSQQVSRARNPPMAIINLSVSMKFSLLLNFKIKTFTHLSLGVHPSRNSFSGRPLVKCVFHGCPREVSACVQVANFSEASYCLEIKIF